MDQPEPVGIVDASSKPDAGCAESGVRDGLGVEYPASAALAPAAPEDLGSPLEPAQLPVAGGCACGGPAGAPAYVYAIGTLRPIFPDLSVEEEFRYAVRQVPGASVTSYHRVFTYNPSPPEQWPTPGQFFYIAENCCWLLEIAGVATYLLQPRSPRELRDLIDAVPPEDEIEPRMTVVIGLLGPVAPSELCGQALPMVLVNQVYHFKPDDLVAEIEGGSPPMTRISQEAIVGVLRALELKPNPGDTDAGRALNYVGLRYRAIYEKADELCTGSGAGMYLSDVRTEPGEVQGNRRIVDVVFEFQGCATDEAIFYYCGVDVTGVFPFLKSALRLYVPVSQK